LNEDGNSQTIINELRQKLVGIKPLEEWTYEEALAATRDLGHIAASLRRLNIGLDNFLELEVLLIQLSQITGEIPRDTVYTYGPRNPDSERRRKFTSLPEEDLFIQSFSDGMNGLNKAIESLMHLNDISVGDSKYVLHIQEAISAFSSMIRAIVEVRRNIPPEMFTGVLRPYFDPISINGKDYLAPGGAQMPILILDLLIGVVDVSNPDYLYYLEDNLQYCPPIYRSLASHIRQNGNTLLQKALREFTELSDQTEREQGRKSLESLRDLLNELIKFRKPHLRVAKDNFALRGSSDVGSGGYKPDILEVLVNDTEKAKSILSNVLSE